MVLHVFLLSFKVDNFIAEKILHSDLLQLFYFSLLGLSQDVQSSPAGSIL